MGAVMVGRNRRARWVRGKYVECVEMGTDVVHRCEILANEVRDALVEGRD